MRRSTPTTPRSESRIPWPPLRGTSDQVARADAIRRSLYPRARDSGDVRAMAILLGVAQASYYVAAALTVPAGLPDPAAGDWCCNTGPIPGLVPADG